MTTYKDQSGRSRHAAGAPASLGGKFAPGSNAAQPESLEPAHASSLTPREEAWERAREDVSGVLESVFSKADPSGYGDQMDGLRSELGTGRVGPDLMFALMKESAVRSSTDDQAPSGLVPSPTSAEARAARILGAKFAAQGQVGDDSWKAGFEASVADGSVTADDVCNLMLEASFEVREERIAAAPLRQDSPDVTGLLHRSAGGSGSS